MIYYVDIDGTICTNTDGQYEKAIPIKENIEKINSLFNKGHTVIYWTARGTITGIDWSALTKQQFLDWGVKYTELKFNKPAYDMLICDKAVNSDFYFSVG